MTSEKKYGLIIPARKKAVAGTGKIAKPSVFGDSSSDEEDSGGRKGFKSSFWKDNKKREKQIQSHEAVVKALEEDPSVFEYDNIYDDLQEKKKKADPRLQKKDNRPKYIYNLKKTAERRKIEQDIIYERKVQRDMEKEGKDFSDKDTFLTSAYRRKLEERKQMEEELRREEEKEAANDVTKQKDLSMFHRHMLNRLDRGAAAKEETRETGKSKEESQTRRVSGEREGNSASQRERERRRSNRRSESDDDIARQRERRRSGEESGHRSRHRSGGSIDEGEGTKHSEERRIENEGDTQNVQQQEDEMNQERVRIEDESEERGREEMEEEDAEQQKVEGEVPKLPSELTQEDKEERRKVAAAKRTGSEAQLSAKERYLARKRARTNAPVLVKDD